MKFGLSRTYFGALATFNNRQKMRVFDKCREEKLLVSFLMKSFHI